MCSSSKIYSKANNISKIIIIKYFIFHFIKFFNNLKKLFKAYFKDEVEKKMLLTPKKNN